jgi:capsular exopolysaccharide synthesis family protein
MKVLEIVHRDWPVATEVRKLQSRLWRLARRDGRKIILVTSSVGGEGKTTTAAFLAATLGSQAGRRILALDLDLRRPKLHHHFDTLPTPGMAEVLEGTRELDEVVRRTELEGLDVVFAGDAAGNVGQLLDSPRLPTVLETLRGRYDLVLVDSPPVVPVADATGIVPLTDGVLLVVMAGKTPRPLLARARELLLGMGAEILGLVVGNAEEASPETYNTRYYHSYGARAGSESDA